MFVIVIPGPIPGEIVKRLVDEASLVLFADDPPENGWRTVKDKIGVNTRDLGDLNAAADALKAHVRRDP